MQNEKKKVLVSFSQREYDDLKDLATIHSLDSDIRFSWRLPRMIHDCALHAIQKNRTAISQLRLIRHQHNEHHRYRYDTIRQCIETIRMIEENTLYPDE